ncbi:MAG: hypothetical protein DHS20C18_45300 [Saprospiraceae bacterium]|nr:MAG: hypothetical protein DHS20C18_45300 [Saprospiraceae bacterium]
MNNSHIISILRIFSKKEIRELRKWLSSPIHNQRDDVAQLFDYLTASNHLEEEKFLNKDRIFVKLFPKEPYDDAKLRQTIHFFSKAVEAYIIYKERSEDEFETNLALAGFYRKRKLDKLFKKTIKRVETLQIESPIRDKVFFEKEFSLYNEKQLFKSGKKRTVSLNLQNYSDALDLDYLAKKMYQTCIILTHQRVFKENCNIGLLDQVLEYVEKNQFFNSPAISIYYYGCKTLTVPEGTTYFKNLKSEIEQYGHQFTHSEIRDIYLMAINYCIGRMNAGNENFVKEAFDLYREGLSKEILIEGNVVSRFTFLNVIRIGLRLKEFDWVDHFITQYEKYLESRHRESIVHYSRSRLYFEKKDYSNAMRLLVQVEYDDILINLNAKTMLLKMYYEQDEFDALEFLLDSLRTYLNRKEVVGYHKANYQNIIRFTKKLTRVTPYRDDQKNKLEKEIQEASPLTEKEWLLQQLKMA